MKSNNISYWNHNFVYYKWVKKQVKDKEKILDVGCGNGELAVYLAKDNNCIVGIDPYNSCIERAQKMTKNYNNISFEVSSFEDFDSSSDSFDAVVFIASFHHMVAVDAIEKAKKILRRGGKIVIVGCARPNSISDWLVEIVRYFPCKIISFFHNEKSSEELDLPTSYNFPTMQEVRHLVKKYLPNAKLSNGLYYRYLLTWTKEK